MFKDKIIQNPEIFKFISVGILNAVFLIFLLVFFTDFIGLFYILSAIIAYEITIILGFIIHDNWTFKKIIKSSKKKNRFLKYNIFSLLGLGLNSLILFILTENIHIEYYYSEIIAIVIVFIFNFSTSKLISFKK